MDIVALMFLIFSCINFMEDCPNTLVSMGDVVYGICSYIQVVVIVDHTVRDSVPVFM